MKLAKSLSSESIFEDLQSRDRRGVLHELARHLADTGAIYGVEELQNRLEEREDLESTGIGEGIAIPHVRLKNLSRPLFAVARSREGVDFRARDGRAVHLFFLLVSPESAAGEHLCALARISRWVREPEFRRSLLAAGSREEMLGIIAREDEKN